jgi:hypothetical protein
MYPLLRKKFMTHTPNYMVVKKGFFTKRTQMENHKPLPIRWMRKTSLASFSKTNPFLRSSKPFKGFQRDSKQFKGSGEKNYFPQNAWCDFSLTPIGGSNERSECRLVCCSGVGWGEGASVLNHYLQTRLLSLPFQAMMLMHY